MSRNQANPNDGFGLAKDDEKLVGAQQRFGCEEDIHDAEEDVEEYFSAHSHISDQSETFIHDLDNDIVQILSEAENQRLNAKIDRLMAALASGRQLRFDRDLVTGAYDVSATYPSTSSSRETSNLEAQIAAAPQNFGNIISSRQEMMRSPSSIQYALTSSSYSSNMRYETWEEAVTAADKRYERENELAGSEWEDEIAAADLRFELEQGVSFQSGVKIRRALRLREQAMGDPRGRRLAVKGAVGVEIHDIYPITLDFTKTVQTSTPSIYSTDSQTARSFPIFKKTYPEMVRYAESWATTSESDEISEHVAPTDRVSEWLERVQTPPHVRTPMLLKGKSKDFKVFRDAAAGEGSPQGYKGVVSSHKILQDMSNLRRPGYLEHNSFAPTKKSAARPAPAQPSRLPPPAFGGAPNSQGRRSYIKSRWPGLLSPVSEQDSPAASDKPLCNPQRAAHFELALARLEGRVSPRPSSPIRRYVHHDGVYGEDVEVDLRLVRVRQPQPARHTEGPSVAQQFEHVLGEEVDPEAHFEYKGNEVDGLTWN